MRVLIVNHTFDSTDGQGKVNACVASCLSERGHGVTLVGRHPPAGFENREGARVIPLSPAAGVPSRLLKHLTFGWRSARVIRDLGTEHDVVIANGGMTFAETDINLCHFVHRSWLDSPAHPRRASGPFRPWGWYQAAYSRQACLWEKSAYRRASRVVAVSDLVKRQLVEDVCIDADKVHVIENGIDSSPTTGDAEEARRLFGFDADRFVIFFAGELRTPRKNFDVLLRALKRLPERVVIAAAGAFEEGPYLAKIRANGLQDRVRLLGMRADVRSLYAGADVFCLMSHYDPFALVVTEAMAASVPVVTARTVGASSVVARFDAGVVLEDPNDDAALAAAIESLMRDEAKRRTFGQNGPKAAAELSWERVGQHYAELIAEVANEKAAQGGRS